MSRRDEASSFDKGNASLGLIHEALVVALQQVCGGAAPILLASDGADDDAYLLPQHVVPPITDADWPHVLATTSRTSWHATTATTDQLPGKAWDVEVRTLASLFNRLAQPPKATKKKKLGGRRNGNKRKAATTVAPQALAAAAVDAGETSAAALEDAGAAAAVSLEENHMASPPPSPALVITSDYGVRRTVSSAYDWAALVLPRMEEALPAGWRGSVLTNPSGFLAWVSPPRAAALWAAGRRPCPTCGAWPKGETRGLWWHEQVQHGLDHAAATAVAATTSTIQGAMCLYQADPGSIPVGDAATSERPPSIHPKHAYSDTSGAQRQALVFGYAAAGDLVRLRTAIDSDWVDTAHVVDSRGASLLLWAAGGGHLDMVVYLVETCGCDARKGQQQDRRGFAGRTALHWACRKGHLTVVRYLLHYCGRPALEDRTADGTTAVGWAAWQGQQDILECLHDEYGCDMLVVNKFGCNALLWAAQGTATPATMKWLVDVAKCPLSHVNGNGHGILHKAAQRNRPKVTEWFLEHVLDLLLLLDSDEEVCQELLVLTGPDREGCTPSDLAGIEGYERLAVQVTEGEARLWRTALQQYPTLPWTFVVDPTAVADDYGPGCGVARLWRLHQQLQSRTSS
jgi:hypothetical protein